jgi:hypothetical protein
LGDDEAGIFDSISNSTLIRGEIQAESMDTVLLDNYGIINYEIVYSDRDYNIHNAVFFLKYGFYFQTIKAAIIGN